MKQTFHWLIVYDIRDAKRLHKVETIVNAYGWRLQKSVYESCADEISISHMTAVLRRTVADEDFLIIFKICERDWQKREIYGKRAAENPLEQTFCIL